MLLPKANLANMLANILTNNVGSNVGQHVGMVCEGLYSYFTENMKTLFFLLVVGRKKSLSSHGRDVDFADDIVLLAS